MSQKLAKLLSTTPEELAQLQHDELKEYVVGQLKKFTRLVEEGSYAKAEAMLATAEGYGYSADYLTLDGMGEGADLGTALEKLQWLTKLSHQAEE